MSFEHDLMIPDDTDYLRDKALHAENTGGLVVVMGTLPTLAFI
jgi:hypothetical protein